MLASATNQPQKHQLSKQDIQREADIEENGKPIDSYSKLTTLAGGHLLFVIVFKFQILILDQDIETRIMNIDTSCTVF